MTLLSSPHQRSPFSLLESYYHNTQCRYCLTDICGQVNLCSQCHYSLHYLQVSCSTGQHQWRPLFLYKKYILLTLFCLATHLVLNMNLRVVFQEQFGYLKVFFIKSPHQWTPLALKSRAITNKYNTHHITYVNISDIGVTVFLLQVASHYFNVSCLTATFCQ